MNLLSLHLQARFPEKNIFRAYSLWIGQDLLGDWVLQITYGRIGSKGTTKTYLCASKEDALHKVKTILKRRQSSYKRIGCDYKLVDGQMDSSIEKNDFKGFLGG
jgi:predicted DNA-binding WGR domain protein